MVLLALITIGYLNVCLRFWTVNVNIPYWVKAIMNTLITIGYLAVVAKLWLLSGYFGGL